ncbi:unnamed protein product [Calypogeia fissa]
MAMYLLIWGEAANLRFYLNECLCYIFHQMVDELYGFLALRDVQRSKTWRPHEGKQYSYLEQVVMPVYQTLLAESRNGGKESHATWRNYDDFNEFFWSPRCFVLQWPWHTDAGFFMKPRKKGAAPVEKWPTILSHGGWACRNIKTTIRHIQAREVVFQDIE